MWLIVTDILSRTVSQLSQLIVQILDTAFLSPSWGFVTTYDVHLGLIGKSVVYFLLVLIELFFARCYRWVATGENSSKIGDFAPTRSVWRAPKPHKGGTQKRKTAVFQVKSHFTWNKSATKFLYVKTVSDKVVRHSLAYLSVRKSLVEDVPFYVKIWRILTHPLAKRRFSIYFRFPLPSRFS